MPQPNSEKKVIETKEHAIDSLESDNPNVNKGRIGPLGSPKSQWAIQSSVSDVWRFSLF